MDMMAREESTPLEREREEMMETRADDLPLGGRGISERNWGIVAAILLAGLAIPLFYVLLSLLGAVATSRTGFLVLSALLVVVFGALVGGVYALIGTGARIKKGNRTRRDASARALLKMAGGRRPLGCGDLDSMEECSRLMYQHNVGFLLVLDNKDRIAGVVTDRDIVCGGIANGLDPRTTPITLVMERNVRVASPTETLGGLLRIMQEEGIRRVPIVEDGVCLGVVSVDDLLAIELCAPSQLGPIFRRQLAEPRGREAA